jgi:hypothetical protein
MTECERPSAPETNARRAKHVERMSMTFAVRPGVMVEQGLVFRAVAHHLSAEKGRASGLSPLWAGESLGPPEKGTEK